MHSSFMDFILNSFHSHYCTVAIDSCFALNVLKFNNLMDFYFRHNYNYQALININVDCINFIFGNWDFDLEL